MNAKHTPGPWKQRHSGYANTPCVIYTGTTAPNFNSRKPLQGCNWIAEVNQDESEQHNEHAANARLIAAAPELLEASKELLMCIAISMTCEERILPDAPELIKIRAAIAKAEGRS